MVPSAKLSFPQFCGRRSGKRRRASMRSIKSFLICVSFGSVCITIMLMLYSYSSKNTFEGSEVEIDLSNNYLQVQDKLPSGGYLVDTNKCRIPNVDIWDAGIRPFVKAPTKFKCAETYMSLTNVVKNTVIINETALKSVGYTLDQITCCYQTIERIDQTRESYDMKADNLFRYSDQCFQMEKTTKPISGFIRVTCKVKGFFESFFNYVNFHMIAILPHDQNLGSRNIGNISEKLGWWKDCLSTNGTAMLGNMANLCKQFRESGRPPNVMVLGWDSTSRGNFHRFMHRTMDILENIIKPVEMVGYHKVGENTFPNFVPLMSSLSEEELVKECYANRSVFQDDCPYIWKRFSASKYLTAHLEDGPTIAAFNYLKTGFLKPPVDVYSRPFMLAAYEEKGGGEDLIDCIGYQRPEEMILNYIVDLAELAETEQIPYFLTTWLTDLTHYDMNNIQLADAIMAKTLLLLNDKGLLQNTVLFLMSDHGYRFLEVRTTTTGWFEDKLPTLWVKLPPSVMKVRPLWMDFLQQNSRQLITPFDLHEALKDILNAYSPSPVEKEIGIDSTMPLIRRGISPFTSKLPNRSCEEAGIPTEYCACIPPTACIFNSSMIKLAAERVVDSINTNLPSECVPLSVATVSACGMFKESSTADLVNNNNGVSQANNKTVVGENGLSSDEVVVVTLQTRPGNFLFEAMVHFNKSALNFGRVFKLMRMNKKTTSSACLVKKDPWMELLCYCDSFSIVNALLHSKFVR